MNRWSHILKEAAHSYRLGLRDALRPRLAFSSILVALAAAVLALVVFIVWADPIQRWAAHWVGLGLAWVWPTLGGVWVSVLKWLQVVTWYVLSTLLLMQVMLELWLMDRIQSVCLNRHPALAGRQHEGSFGLGVLDAARTLAIGAAGTVVCLFIPLVGGLLLLALSSYLAVRSLVNDALQGLATDDEVRTLIRTSRPQMLALGLLLAMTALIPFAGFLVPVVAGASTCHLMMSRLQRLPGSPTPGLTPAQTTPAR